MNKPKEKYFCGNKKIMTFPSANVASTKTDSLHRGGKLTMVVPTCTTYTLNSTLTQNIMQTERKLKHIEEKYQSLAKERRSNVPVSSPQVYKELSKRRVRNDQNVELSVKNRQQSSAYSSYCKAQSVYTPGHNAQKQSIPRTKLATSPISNKNLIKNNTFGIVKQDLPAQNRAQPKKMPAFNPIKSKEFSRFPADIEIAHGGTELARSRLLQPVTNEIKKIKDELNIQEQERKRAEQKKGSQLNVTQGKSIAVDKGQSKVGRRVRTDDLPADSALYRRLVYAAKLKSQKSLTALKDAHEKVKRAEMGSTIAATVGSSIASTVSTKTINKVNKEEKMDRAKTDAAKPDAAKTVGAKPVGAKPVGAKPQANGKILKPVRPVRKLLADRKPVNNSSVMITKLNLSPKSAAKKITPQLH